MADEWRSRLQSADEAVAEAVRPGDRVFLGTGCATPARLVAALEGLTTPPPGVEFVHFVTNGGFRTREGRPATRYRHRVFLVGSETRGFVRPGRVDYVPVSLPDFARLVRAGRLPIDVAMVQVTPPDEHGLCNLGLSVDVTRAAVDRARTVVAEVVPHMPRTSGETTIPVEEIDHLVWVEAPVFEYLHEPVDDVAEQIARYIARIIDDGATLQIGLGRIPNQMLQYLDNRHDLGVHSDVITDPLVDLIERGVVTGRRKTHRPERVVTSYAMGSRRLYKLLDGNQMFEFRPIEEVCDPGVIAANNQMVSVTQAFAIDLTGQVCADQFEGEFYGGVSAQPDFMRGAAAAEDGKAIVCLASTTEDGTQSRIRPVLHAGEGVTIARSDVHFVVTEYGIAYLFGKGISERALALIEIAHPDFRAGLLEEAKTLGYVSSGQELESRVAYPAAEERDVTLRDGRSVLVRPTRASDVPLMQQLFYALRPEDVYTRFFANLQSLSVSHADHLCNVDYEKEMAFLVVAGGREGGTAVASSCYYLDPSTNLADVAYIVHPNWQGLGLGSLLQARTIEYAKSRGIRGFTADVLLKNAPMLAVFEKSGARIEKEVADGAYEITMLFD